MSPHRSRITLSSRFKIRLEEAIALYESVLVGSFNGFNRGRKAQASNCLVTVPWVRNRAGSRGAKMH